MSTTDTRAAFEEWAESGNGSYTDAWAAWQAATEAAKATGTAGEQKPIAYAVYSCAGIHRLHSVKPIVDDEWRSDDDCLGEYWAGNEPLYAEAARQPAPVVAVKAWQECMFDNAEAGNQIGSPQRFMRQEIADLRAALAATNRSQP